MSTNSIDLTTRAGLAALAGIFVYGGRGAFKNAAKMAPMIEGKAGQLGLAKLPVGGDVLVKANGAAMVAGGLALGLGVAPRPVALGLVASLVPTTLAGHAFWDEETPEGKNAQTIQFLKNLGLVGGLLVAARKA